MQLVQLWARSLALFVALSGSAYADAALSPQTDPAASVDSRLSLLLGQERSSLSAVAPSRLEEITTPPAPPADGKTPQIQYTEDWIDAQPVATGGADWSCLAKAIYFEARGESVKGEFAVAEVVANRADSPDFPHDICSVVNQGAGHPGGCQFSFVCDGMTDRIGDPVSYEKAGKIARLILDGAPRALTEGATYFHTVWVHPPWSHRFEETAEIGAHVFYRDSVQLASN